MGTEGVMAELVQAHVADAGQAGADVGAAEGTVGAPAMPPDHDGSTGDKVSRAADTTGDGTEGKGLKGLRG